MNITIRTHRYRWVCPDCGPVEDRSVEALADVRALGRWFEDGHQGLTRADDQEIEYHITRHLGVPFPALEAVRSQRSRRRLENAQARSSLDAQDLHLFDELLREHGHRVVRVEQVLEVRD